MASKNYYPRYKQLKRLNMTKIENIMVIELLMEILEELKKVKSTTQKLTDEIKSKRYKNKG